MELLDRILSAALAVGASDIHLKPGGVPVFRVHRELHLTDAPALTQTEVEAVVQALLPAAAHEVFLREHEADVSYAAEGIGRFRVNVYWQRGEPCIAMRFVKHTVPSFEDLGLPRPFMEELATLPSGMVLIAGTTGAGKSTTLASLVSRVNESSRRHIVTLEDPIEFVFEDRESIIEQREIGLDTRDFPTALKHVIRQDPDIIVIGEMRDGESFRAGIAAADTGHVVLTTLHANNVRQAVDRVLDFFQASEREQIRRQLAVAMSAIICQRLIPAVDGGVLPALEILATTETVRKLFHKDRLDQLESAMSQGKADGMRTFDQSLYALAQEKRISRETALAHASNPEQLGMNFRGIFTSETRLIS